MRRVLPLPQCSQVQGLRERDTGASTVVTARHSSHRYS